MCLCSFIALFLFSCYFDAVGSSLPGMDRYDKWLFLFLSLNIFFSFFFVLPGLDYILAYNLVMNE